MEALILTPIKWNYTMKISTNETKSILRILWFKNGIFSQVSLQKQIEFFLEWSDFFNKKFFSWSNLSEIMCQLSRYGTSKIRVTTELLVDVSENS